MMTLSCPLGKCAGKKGGVPTDIMVSVQFKRNFLPKKYFACVSASADQQMTRPLTSLFYNDSASLKKPSYQGLLNEPCLNYGAAFFPRITKISAELLASPLGNPVSDVALSRAESWEALSAWVRL